MCGEKNGERDLGVVRLEVPHHLVELILGDLSLRVSLPQDLWGFAVATVAPVAARIASPPTPTPPPAPEEAAGDEEDDEEEDQEAEGEEVGTRVVSVRPRHEAVVGRDQEDTH